jgi:NAD(P)-dependent dehydrogenase (short-subunit alcohol dehydrogenase family)
MVREHAQKVVLVTGGGSGIGRATAHAFARAGARVAVADIIAGTGEETVRQITTSGGEAVFIQADVADAAQVKHVVQQVVETYARLDYACNNAGVEGCDAGLTDHPEEEWDRVLAINLKGVWLCMKHEIPAMLKHGGGAIVNTASVAGLVGSAGTVAYTASKYGVVGMTKVAALEFAQQGIRVNAVCPGLIRTPMLEQFLVRDPALEPALTALEPMGRIGAPEEVARAIIWLCSDAASFITGVSLPVDGGWIAK